MADTTGTDGKRAAIYLRVSTEDQARDGYGLDVQRERCRAQVTAKGWTLAGEYADEGISGTLDVAARPALAELVAAAESGDVDAVVVLALDRLGRATAVVLRLVERLAAAGCELVSCKESLDTSTPQGAFVLTMFAALAQLERDTIRDRTTAGRNARGAVDGERGGSVPFGYARVFEDGRAVGVRVDPEAAIIVRRIYARRRAGATLVEIANALNEAGIVSPRGGPWYASSVRVVLGNGASYAGGGRGASSVRWPQIIRPTTAAAVVEVDGRQRRP